MSHPRATRSSMLHALALCSLLGLASCASTPQVRYVCPSLSPAPLSALDALEQTGRKDPSTAAWVIDLDRHYQKCDEVNRSRTR